MLREPSDEIPPGYPTAEELDTQPRPFVASWQFAAGALTVFGAIVLALMIMR